MKEHLDDLLILSHHAAKEVEPKDPGVSVMLVEIAEVSKTLPGSRTPGMEKSALRCSKWCLKRKKVSGTSLLTSKVHEERKSAGLRKLHKTAVCNFYKQHAFLKTDFVKLLQGSDSLICDR